MQFFTSPEVLVQQNVFFCNVQIFPKVEMYIILSETVFCLMYKCDWFISISYAGITCDYQVKEFMKPLNITINNTNGNNVWCISA